MTRNIRIAVETPEKLSNAYRDFEIDSEITSDMTVMELLRYLSSSSAPELVFYDHSSCGRGLCGRCGVRLNGKTCLACNTVLPVSGNIIIEPISRGKSGSGPFIPA